MPSPICCPFSHFTLEFRVIDSARPRPLPPSPRLLPFMCPSSTPSQGQWLAINLIFGTAKRKSIICEIKLKKTKRDINMGEQMGQSGMWCLEHRSRQEERHSHCYCAHCDAASVWLPYGRSSGMNNAMISLSVFSVWLLATSGKGTKRRCTWGKTHPHFSFWHDSFSDRCGCAAFSL